MNKTQMTQALVIELGMCRYDWDKVNKLCMNGEITKQERYERVLKIEGRIDGINYSRRAIGISNVMWNKHLMKI